MTAGRTLTVYTWPKTSTSLTSSSSALTWWEDTSGTKLWNLWVVDHPVARSVFASRAPFLYMQNFFSIMRCFRWFESRFITSVSSHTAVLLNVDHSCTSVTDRLTVYSCSSLLHHSTLSTSTIFYLLKNETLLSVLSNSVLFWLTL